MKAQQEDREADQGACISDTPSPAGQRKTGVIIVLIAVTKVPTESNILRERLDVAR